MNEEKTCTLCGKCLDACPVFNLTLREDLSPKSKLFLIDLFKQHRFEAKDIEKLAGICLSCGRCAYVCPYNIEVYEVIWRFKNSNPTWKNWIWSKIVASLPIISSFKTILPSSFHFFLNYKSQSWLKVLKISKRFDKKVLIFSGCIWNFIKKDWKDKARSLLLLAGYEVVGEVKGCCSFPYLSTGLFDEALLCQKKIVSLWRSLKEPLIAVFCGTCYFTLKEKIEKRLFSKRELKTWKDSVYLLWDLFEILDYELNKDYLYKKKIALHIPCHLLKEDFYWFDNILKLEKIDSCCGFGGSMYLENKEIVEKFATHFWEKKKKWDEIFSFCSGCVIQLNYKIPKNKKAYHFLDTIQL